MTHTQTQGADGAGTKTAGEDAFPKAVLAALDRFRVQTISGDVEPRDDDTWAVIDTKTADPMTNWPGELVSEHPTYDEARIGVMKAVLAVASGQDRTASRKLCPSCQGSRGGMIGESGGSPDWDNCWTCNGEGFVPAPAATPGVPDSVRALSEAASPDWDTNEATPYILGPPIDGEIDRFEVIARGPHGHAKSGDAIRKWQANRMFAVAAVNFVRTLIAAQPAGQAGDAGEDLFFNAEGRKRIKANLEAVSPFEIGALVDDIEKLLTAPDSTRTGAAESDDLSDRLRREIGEIRTMAADPENKAAFCELTVVADNLEALLPAADQEGAR